MMEVGVVPYLKGHMTGWHQSGVDLNHCHRQGGITTEDMNLRGPLRLEVVESPFMMFLIGNQEHLKGPLVLVKTIHPHQDLHRLSIVIRL